MSPSLGASAFFQSLTPVQQEAVRKLLGPKLGYKMNALFMAFPYMSPNNNNQLFADLLARYFVLNRARGAVKEPQ